MTRTRNPMRSAVIITAIVAAAALLLAFAIAVSAGVFMSPVDPH